MPESILIDITIVVLLGVGAQWLGWRFRLPSILLLLIGGFLAGPVLGLLDPAALQHDWVYAFVSLAVGIILFEGGLSLRIGELREAGTAIRNLITVGVLVTWVLGAAAAYYIIGFNLSLAILVGAILIVTGPTVVTPLLRHVRPKGRVGTIAKWEGITIDPIGAILAVLVLQTITLLHEPQSTSVEASLAISHVIEGLFLEVFVSLGVSVAAAALLIVLLHRRLVPDFLRNSVTLMILVAAFVVAESLQREAGLLTATLMGIAVANQPYVSVQRITEFKENLQVLLLGSLFIVLSARLELDILQHVNVNTLLFLGILVLVVRPLAVFASSLGTDLSWEEQTFLAWLAPRGVVAAAVAALFSFKLAPIFPQEAGEIVPVTFSIIVGTVALYGLTLAPLAHWLGLAEPDPQGILFVGAAPWVRKIARVVQALGFAVHLIDANDRHVERARREDLPAEHVNPLSETAPYDIDLSSIRQLLIMLPNGEASSLTALHFSELFDTSDIFQLATYPADHADDGPHVPKHLRGHLLFSDEASYATLDERIEQGHAVKVFALSEQFDYERLQEYYDGALIPLFLIQNGTLSVISEQDRMAPPPGAQLVALVDPERAAPDLEPPEILEPDQQALQNSELGAMPA